MNKIFYLSVHVRTNKEIRTQPEALQSLDLGYRTGAPHCFRMRCMAVLLKAKGLSAATVGSLTDMLLASVNHWVKRYQSEDLSGLYTKPGQGRKPLFYGDESHVCTEGYVPYGWQFPGEQVCILSERSARLNCFAMINRKSECFQFTTQENMDARKVMEFLEGFSLKITKETFLVLDNASVHRAKCIQERIPFWEKRGFFLFYLPPYSPHLNIAETIWRMLKGRWIKPEYYIEK